MTQQDNTRDIILDALVDTLLGNAPWDPNARTLSDHLSEVVQRRVSTDKDRGEIAPHPLLGANTRTVPDDGSFRAQGEAEHAADIVAEFCRRAAGDAEVLALIDATVQAATLRTEVMRLTDLSTLQHGSAGRRLILLVTELTDQAYRRRQRNKGE